jgi:hypothetical protein
MLGKKVFKVRLFTRQGGILGTLVLPKHNHEDVGSQKNPVVLETYRSQTWLPDYFSGALVLTNWLW